MSIATASGLRDQRIRVYARSDQGSNGLVRAVFRFTGEWWARLDEITATSRGSEDHVQAKFDAQAQFSDEAVLAVNGILKDEDGFFWWIRGINAVRATNTTVVGCDRVNDDESKTFTLYEGESVLDGVHLVDPA